MRALARAAGVSHNALARLRQGTLAATPQMAVKLAEALEVWGAGCQRAAKRLRKAARRVPIPRSKGKS
jgi:transcriptional regulator with XRE-family HTH domain